jgi:hypothetical protein
MKYCQNLLTVDLVNGLTFSHPINGNNPSDIEKTIVNALKFDLRFRSSFFFVIWDSSNACIGA